MTRKPNQSIVATVFQWAVIGGGGLVWVFSALRFRDNGTPRAFLETAIFALAIVLISSRPVMITMPGRSNLNDRRQLSISLSDCLTFLLLILYGAAPAILVSGLDGFIASRRTVKRWTSNLFTWGMFSLSVLGAARAYQFTLSAFGLSSDPGTRLSTFQLVIPLLVAAAIHFLISSILLSTILGLRYRTSIVRQWIDNQLWTAVTYFPLALASLIPYVCAVQFGWITMIALLPILTLIYFSLSQYNRRVEDKVRQIQEMNELNLSLAQALAMAIDAKDNTTAEHVQRVQIYGRGMAKLCGLSEPEAQAIEAGAMLHDVGKLAIPDYILNKPGKLTSAEYEKVKIHPVVGAEILSHVKFPFPVVPVVRHHHERWDGLGYPDGLKGEEIPLTARILSVIDCFDAVQEDRQWRKAMTGDEAVNTIASQAGTFYDPQLVALFIANLGEFELEIERRGLRPELAVAADGGGAIHQTIESTIASSHEKIKEANREVSLLYEIAQTLGSSLSLPDTLEFLMKRIAEVVPFTTGTVFLQRDRLLEAVFATGPDAGLLSAGRLQPGSGIAGWVFERQEPMFNSDPRLDFAAMQINVSHDYRTSVVVPLIKQGSAIGALALYSADLEKYSVEHTRLVEAIAGMAGDAIANAIQHEEIETTALTDRLTGLPNLRSIVQRFDDEAARAAAAGQSFTLLMMDLDGFKQINDKLGHQTGDRYLAEIGRIIGGQMRDRDFFGRYGGDEFIAILPSTVKSLVDPLLERVREAVEGFVLPVEGGAAAAAGISLGVAEFGIDGESMDELMAVADLSMYADKEFKSHRAEMRQSSSQVVRFPRRLMQRAV
ncbi:MAG: diguanylate cyclase [Pyrinomonadaceae bacterium]